MQWLFFWMYKCKMIDSCFPSPWEGVFETLISLIPQTQPIPSPALSSVVLFWHSFTGQLWTTTHTHAQGCFYFSRWKVQFFTFSFKWWKSEKEMICNQRKGLVLRFRAPYENVGTPCYRIQRSRWINYQVAGDPDRWIERSEPSCSNALYDMDKKVLDKKPTWHVAPHHRRCTGNWIPLVSHCSESRKAI
jgi:hypothetical protein